MSSSSPHLQASVRELGNSLGIDLRKVAYGLVLFLFAVGLAFRAIIHPDVFAQSDVWLHLRAGIWMLQNFRIPKTGLFSQYQSFPWVDLNWLYQIVLAAAYKGMGLRSLAFLQASAIVLFTIVTFGVIGGFARFWTAFPISAVALFAVGNISTPILLSASALAVVMTILLAPSRDERVLVFLPVVIWIWAGLDASFVFGVAAVLIATSSSCIDVAISKSLNVPEKRNPQCHVTMAACSFGCLLASFLTPNMFSVWREACVELYSKVLFDNSPILKSIQFRSAQDYALLFLCLLAWLTIGCRRTRGVFAYLVLAIATGVAFRMQRDLWVAVVTSVAVLGSAPTNKDSGRNRCSARISKELVFAGTAALISVVIATVLYMPRQDDAMLKKFGQELPTSASNYVRGAQLSGPIFNGYEFGGFLTWYLPEYPVSIDNRIGLYGQAITEQYFQTVSGKGRLENSPAFSSARIIFIKRGTPLAIALTTLPRLKPLFDVIYDDDVAVILTRR